MTVNGQRTRAQKPAVDTIETLEDDDLSWWTQSRDP